MASKSKHQDRAEKLKAFDKTIAGVKGLVDSGISYVPDMFIHPSSLTTTHEYPKAVAPAPAGPILPVIDLAGCRGTDAALRGRVVGEMCEAAERYGFFHVVGHGIAGHVLEEKLRGACGFFEQDLEVKKKHFSRDYFGRSCAYNSNFDLYV